MKEYIESIKNSKLFYNISTDEISFILDCLAINVKKYKKEQIIYRVGDSINELPFILEGSVRLENEDFFGNKTILYEVYKNDIFGAAYYFNNQPLPVNVIAVDNCKLLYLNLKKAFDLSYNCCHQNNKISKNFLSIIINKNMAMAKKIEHISHRSIRNKLLSYLSEQAFINKSNDFYINFNRQQLADYLCVDRSALSNELSKMQKENIIEFHKNHFVLNTNFEI